MLFDEATNWLDNQSQATVMRNLAALTATRLVIAHRLSTLEQADRIYVLRAGRVRAERLVRGTHGGRRVLPRTGQETDRLTRRRHTRESAPAVHRSPRDQETSMKKPLEAADTLVSESLPGRRLSRTSAAGAQGNDRSGIGRAACRGSCDPRARRQPHHHAPGASAARQIQRGRAPRGANRGGIAGVLKRTLHDPAPPIRPPAPGGRRSEWARPLPTSSRTRLERASAGVSISGIQDRRKRGLALHPVQCRQSGHSKAFRKSTLRFGILRTCPRGLR